MNGVQTIQAALGATQFLFSKYLEDLSDADLLVRPVPGANHLAWQLGHVIAGEVMLIRSQLPDAAYPELPAGWNDAYAGAGASKDSPADFHAKSDYLQHFNAVRKATLAVVAGLTDADLDRPTLGKMAPFAPRLGDMLLLASNHTLMHGGQASVVRRKLGKPVLF